MGVMDRLVLSTVFLVEDNHESEHLPNTDGGTAQNLRRQEYWTMLSGAAGQLYGSRYLSFEQGWETDLNTRGVIELGYMKSLFAHRKWYDLVPDQTHSVTRAGYDWLDECVAKLTAYLGSSRVLEFWMRFERLFSLSKRPRTLDRLQPTVMRRRRERPTARS